MAKLIGYMLTWTTYGSWLQGDKRGFVRDGEILQGDERILELCKKFQKGPTVKLTKQEMIIIEMAILKEAERIGHKIEALAVCPNHVHLAAKPCEKSIERLVSMYKSVATRALRCYGRMGRIWTKGFDKRFCFTQNALARKIAYIQNHKQRLAPSLATGEIETSLDRNEVLYETRWKMRRMQIFCAGKGG